MPEVSNGDVRLHVEVDGAGEPVTVFAHGLTNSCRELAPFTPSLAGTVDLDVQRDIAVGDLGHGSTDSQASIRSS